MVTLVVSTRDESWDNPNPDIPGFLTNFPIPKSRDHEIIRKCLLFEDFSIFEKKSWFPFSLIVWSVLCFFFFVIFNLFRFYINVIIGYLKDIYYLILHYFQSKKSQDQSRDQLFQSRIPGLKKYPECINTSHDPKF